MKLDTEQVAKGLYDEIGIVLAEFNGALLTPTVIGVLEMIKSDLLYQAAFDPNHPANKDEDEDEDD